MDGWMAGSVYGIRSSWSQWADWERGTTIIDSTVDPDTSSLQAEYTHLVHLKPVNPVELLYLCHRHAYTVNYQMSFICYNTAFTSPTLFI